ATLEDALKGFALSIARAFGDMMARLLVEALLSNGMMSAAGGIGSMIGTLITGSIAMAARAEGGLIGAGANDGAIPFRAFALGGIATRSTLALVAEAGRMEAVVPVTDRGRVPIAIGRDGEPVALLPGGRALPGEFTGDTFGR